MSAANHMPGPWRVIAHGGARYQVEEHTETVAFSLTSDYSEATARLIASAPELLDQLVAAFEESQKAMMTLGTPMNSVEWHNKTKAVLAKATGVPA